MSVYVDKLLEQGWVLGPSCHMVADTLAELHEMADRIGLRRAWFQGQPKHSIPHYDLVASRRARAVKLGAIEVERYGFVAVIRRARAAGWP